MSKERKARTHRLTSNTSFVRALILALVIMFVCFYAIQFSASILAAIPLYMTGREAAVENVATCITIPCGFAVLFLFYRRYRPEYQWKPRNPAFAFKITAPILIYWFILYCILYTVAAGHFTFGLPADPFKLVFSISAGICEEVAFREIGISLMKRQSKEDQKNLPIVLIISVVFGLSHLMNSIGSSIPFYYFLIQVTWTALLGIFFGAVFLRTGNIWPCLIAHAIHDMLADFFRADYDVVDEPAYIDIFMTVGLAALAAYGLYLIRKETYPEIRKLWDEKWQIAEAPAESAE